MTTEIVAPEKLSDADLDKALEGDEQIINDDGEIASEEAEPTIPVDADDGETEGTVGAGATTAPAKTDTPPAETLEDRLAKLEKRLADKDRYIEERNAEIGRLRKQVAEPQKKLHEVSADTFFEDPIANVEKITENQRIKLEQEQQRREEQMREMLEHRRTVTKQIAPDYEQNIDLVVEVLKQDGFDDDGIKAFRSNPFAYEPPLLHNLNLRAKLAKENADLRAEIARLKGGPKKILDNIETISRQRPKVTGNSAAARGEGGLDAETLDEKAIAKLSDAQLKALLAKSRR